jgi:hypothetical protein
MQDERRRSGRVDDTDLGTPRQSMATRRNRYPHAMVLWTLATPSGKVDPQHTGLDYDHHNRYRYCEEHFPRLRRTATGTPTVSRKLRRMQVLGFSAGWSAAPLPVRYSIGCLDERQ